jgi:hypothetical protein
MLFYFIGGIGFACGLSLICLVLMVILADVQDERRDREDREVAVLDYWYELPAREPLA